MDVDSWTAYWNGRADHEAAMTHALRPYELESVRRHMLDHHHNQTDLMQRFAEFHFKIAEVYHAKDTENFDEDDIEQTPDDCDGLDGQRPCHHNVPWQRVLPVLPGNDVGLTQMIGRFGYVFTRDLLDWLRGETFFEDAVTYKTSLVELAIHLGLGKVNTRLPLPDPKQKLRWSDPQAVPAAMVCKQTVAAILKLVQIFSSHSLTFLILKSNGLNIWI